MDRRLFVLSALTLPLYAGPLVTFTPGEAKFLEALVDQIIPPDDSPGAAQAGVVFYIDKQLAGPLKRFVPNYRRGIPALQSAAGAKSGPELAAFLQTLTGPNAAFFNLLADHTMQGFYGSPAHGGNLNQASWKMLGIENLMDHSAGGHSH